MGISIVLILSGLTQQQEPQSTLTNDVSNWIQLAENRPADEAIKKSPIDYWLWQMPGDLIQRFERAVKNGVPIGTVRSEARRIVRKFGTNAYYDFRMHLALDHVLDPMKNIREKELQELFAEVQVKNWLLHPEKVERTTWFVAWRSEKLPVHTWDDKVPTDKWRKIRLFMVLACMSSSQDLYLGKSPASVLENYSTWKERFAEAIRGQRVSPSGYAPAIVIHPKGTKLGKTKDPRNFKLGFIPQTPFPDWKGLPAPITPRVFRELQ